MEYMLDTNTCIYIIKKHPALVIHRLREALPIGVGLSTVVLSELEFGVARSSRPRENQEALVKFLFPLQVALYDELAARHYGGIKAALYAMGMPIGPLDVLIAAHALSSGCTLVTNNESEFARIPGLKIENWTL